jgi:hypothetical protein
MTQSFNADWGLEHGFSDQGHNFWHLGRYTLALHFLRPDKISSNAGRIHFSRMTSRSWQRINATLIAKRRRLGALHSYLRKFSARWGLVWTSPFNGGVWSQTSPFCVAASLDWARLLGIRATVKQGCWRRELRESPPKKKGRTDTRRCRISKKK